MSMTDLQRELKNLENGYSHELETLEQRIKDARRLNAARDHDAFNMAATCQNLAVLAGKIEQTANIIRWMGETK